MTLRWLRAFVALVVMLSFPAATFAQRALERRTLDIGGVQREALVALPAKDAVPAAGAPLVLVFHGHGGTARNVSQGFRTHELWPEAIVAYPQGLPTPGQLTDPEGKKNGWQRTPGDQRDRDLLFVDRLIESLGADRTIDRSRVYATGHSNGGGFTYLLWEARPDLLAAVAPSGAGTRGVRNLKPLPMMHIAGETDPLVRYDMQMRVVDAVKRINGCNAEGKPWAERSTIFESPGGTPVVTFIHPGGHEFPRDAAPLIVRFLKEHAKKGKAATTSEVRAFYIGHSLMSDIPDMVKALAEATPGISFRFKEQFTPGAPLRWQWDEKTRDPEKRSPPEPQFRGFWFDVLPTKEWNALVLIDSVPRGNAEMKETRQYAESFAREALAANPACTIYVYEPWHCIKSGTPEGCAYDTSSPTRTLAWAARLEADRAMWDDLVRDLGSALPNAKVRLIPAGRALLALDRAVAAGNVPGVTSSAQLFDDDIHLNPYGKYFVACVHYATLFGRSPVGLPFEIKDRWGGPYWNHKNWQGKEWPPPKPETIAAMQCIAWEAVEGTRTR
jgi:polyhydroxybutyrate depolymerase